MNYTVVINSAIWAGALIYYFVDARKWFTGPKITIDTDDLTEAQQKAIAEDGLDIKGLEGVTRTVSADESSSGNAEDVKKD